MYQKQDNRYKWSIRDRLVDTLYEPVTRLMDARLRVLIERNCALLQAYYANADKVPAGCYHKSFAFNGNFYAIEHDGGPVPHNPLHPALEAEAREWEKDHHQFLVYEKSLVAGYLTSVLSCSNIPGDWKVLLPDTLGDELQRTVLLPDGVDWQPALSQEKIDAFLTKYQAGHARIRQRLAMNLLL